MRYLLCSDRLRTELQCGMLMQESWSHLCTKGASVTDCSQG